MLGLGKYEAAVYKALLKNGSMTAAELHKKSGVPTNRIYDIVVSLERRGFLKVQGTEPKIFEAVAPKIVFQKLGAELDSERRALEEVYLKPKEAKAKVLITHGKHASILARFEEHKKLQKELLVFVGKEPATTTEELATISREAKRNLDSGKTINFLANMNFSENVEKAKRLSKFGAKFRHYPVEGFTMSIRDGREIRIEIPDQRFGRLNLWVEDKNLSEFMKSVFEKLWKDGEDWKRFEK